MGSDDETIIRIFVSRAEIDLRWGKDIYLRIIKGHSMYTGWWLKGIRRWPTERWKLLLNRLGKVVMTVVTTFLIILDICSMLYYVQDTGGDYSKILLKLLNPESKIAWALKITSQRFPRFRLSRCLISNQSDLFGPMPDLAWCLRNCENIAIGLSRREAAPVVFRGQWPGCLNSPFILTGFDALANDLTHWSSLVNFTALWWSNLRSLGNFIFFLRNQLKE